MYPAFRDCADAVQFQVQGDGPEKEFDGILTQVQWDGDAFSLFNFVLYFC